MMTRLFMLLMLALAFQSCAQGEEQQKESDQTQSQTDEPTAKDAEPIAGNTTVVTKDVEPAEFQKLINSLDNAVIIDLRTDAEIMSGVIEGYLLANYMDKKNYNPIIANLDKERPVLLYCASGGRSSRAMKEMKEMGFNEIYNLDGGFRAWEAQGLPTVSP